MDALQREPFDVNTITEEVEGEIERIVQAHGKADPYPYDSARPWLSDPSTARRPDSRVHIDSPEQGSSDHPEAIQTTEALLEERSKTHGDFSDHARITQTIKRTMEVELNWNALTDVQREALHMVAHKIGRIMAGNPHHQDHWDDIAGYAKLVSQRV